LNFVLKFQAFLILIGGLLYSNTKCYSPPIESTYATLLEECNEKWNELYYKGNSKNTGNYSQSYNNALSNLIEQISVYVESGYDEDYTESTDNVEYLIKTSDKSYSSAYIIDPIIIKYQDEIIVYKNKIDYKNEHIKLNNILLENAKSEYEYYDTEENPDNFRFEGLINSYIHIRSISNFNLHDADFSADYTKTLRKIQSAYDSYINGLIFTPINQIIYTTHGIANNEKIDIRITHKNKNQPLPSKVFAKITTNEFLKEINVNDGFISFDLGIITSRTSDPKIYFYPKLSDKNNNEINRRYNDFIYQLDEINKTKAFNREFGDGQQIKVIEEIRMSYNKDKLLKKLGSMKIMGQNTDLYNIIEDIINEKHIYDPSSTENIYFNFELSDDFQYLIMNKINNNKPRKVFLKKTKWGDQNKKNSYMISVWKDSHSRNSIKKIIRNYVLSMVDEITTTKLMCSVCSNNKIIIKYKDKNNKTTTDDGLPFSKNNDFVRVKNGGLKSIKFYNHAKKTSNEYLYATISADDFDYNELYLNKSIELHEILELYLKKNNLYESNKHLLKDGEICYSPSASSFTLQPPYALKGNKSYYLKDFNIKWGADIISASLISNNELKLPLIDSNEDIDLTITRDKHNIYKTALNHRNSKSDAIELKGSLFLKENYNHNVFLQIEKTKKGPALYLIPGVSNYFHLKTQKLNKIRGVFKMILSVAFAGYAYDEYKEYDSYKTIYEDYKHQYETLVDGTPNAYASLEFLANYNYDKMREHQDAQNIGLVGLGGLYVFNILQYRFR